MRTPERRTLTGWRCRIREPRTARTRLRFVLGMPTRKTDFQICELTMPSWTCLNVTDPPSTGCWVAGLLGCWVGGTQQPRNLATQQPVSSYLQKRIRIRPLAPLAEELDRLVDEDLPVGGIDRDLHALERPRRRTFEIDSGAVVAAAVAGALELVLR